MIIWTSTEVFKFVDTYITANILAAVKKAQQLSHFLRLLKITWLKVQLLVGKGTWLYQESHQQILKTASPQQQ